MAEYNLAQVFIKKSKGQLEFLLVLENIAGARHRESLHIDTLDYKKAIKVLARRLYYRGDIVSVADARLRLEQNQILKDNKALLNLLIDEFEEYFYE